MEIINIFWTAIRPFLYQIFSRFFQGNSVPVIDYKDTPDKVKKLVPDESYLYKDAFKRGKAYFLIHKNAFLRGVSIWLKKSKIYKGKKYNNLLYSIRDSKANPKYLKVMRYYSKKGLSHIDTDPTLSRLGYYEAIKKRKNSTWCNAAASIFSMEYFDCNMQYFNGKEYNANQLIANIRDGLYDTLEHCFKKCSLQDATACAARGGLAYPTHINRMGGSGHIATLTGNGNEIIQAGKRTGVMSLSEGFGVRLLSKLSYYKLVKVVKNV